MSLKTVEHYWDKIKPFTSVLKDEFINTIKIILESTYFVYNKKIYKQTLSTVMDRQAIISHNCKIGVKTPGRRGFQPV